MIYELWDVVAGNGVARSQSEDDTWALVRTLLETYGRDYAENLELAIEDADGTPIEMLSGASLVARATAPLPVGSGS